MKKLILIVALLSTSCAAKMPATYTPQTKQLYVLTDVVTSIGTLQIAAENAVPAKILTLPTARRIVQFCVAANTTIGQTPNGWYSMVNVAYQELKLSLTPDEMTKFSGAFSAFEIVLYSFSGGK